MAALVRLGGDASEKTRRLRGRRTRGAHSMEVASRAATNDALRTSCLLAYWSPVSFAGVSRENLSGATHAGYKLHDMVGEGGTAAVYRADYPQHGTVEVKVLWAKLRSDRTADARGLRSATY